MAPATQKKRVMPTLPVPRIIVVGELKIPVPRIAYAKHLGKLYKRWVRTYNAIHDQTNHCPGAQPETLFGSVSNNAIWNILWPDIEDIGVDTTVIILKARVCPWISHLIRC